MTVKRAIRVAADVLGVLLLILVPWLVIVVLMVLILAMLGRL